MGTEKGAPPHLSPRLEGYAAALRVYGYPENLWDWLIRWATTLHGMVHGMTKVEVNEWYAEFWKHKKQCGLEELL